MKRIAVLGATGSIGTSCLDVVASQRDEFEIRYLTTNQNVEKLYHQARRFKPRAVAVIQEEPLADYSSRFRNLGVEVYSGFAGLLEICQKDDYDILVNGLVGAVGLKPTLAAIRPGRRIALANKETLVLGGKLVMTRAREVGAEIIPIDSEHSALLQCILGEEVASVQRIILTASGGPFRQKALSEFADITVGEALDHPNWDMGPKITIDSATLMNKGLEVIEAFWLFDLDVADIEVVIHPQSIIHSMVEFSDCSIKAQLGLPDMRLPIQYALTFPRRLRAHFPRLDFKTLNQLTFEQPDLGKFKCLRLSYEAIEQGGAAPAVLNASNEEAVNLFLNKMIRFDQIPAIVEATLSNCGTNSFDGVDDLIEYDTLARKYVQMNFAK